MTYETIEVDIRGRIAVLTFNRPKVLNAFDGVLVDETMGALKALGADDRILAIVVRGSGRAFSAGFDLKAGAATAGSRTLPHWRRMLEADFDFIMGFWDCPKPTIAAVHGYCIGGAFELSLACDVTVAAASTRFGAPEVKFGSGAVALLLPWIAGPKAAKELLLTGDDRLDAARALALGIVNHVVPDGEEFDRAIAIAESMASAAPAAVRLTKLAINRSFDAMGLRAALASALELDIYIEGSGGPERAEFDRIRREQGLKAALEWRDARAAS
ncbi:enoyl-CoA hydratase [Prosthecomicrobium hirschii]|uniref:Enoyl-CoA hydratase n=1 Tax=Prosthecodimorpha hirschii TaxID=665126 RepID=A0A0P6W3I9_9HYPH|nr:enoyl-CoA hydratase-related protein [Prosthecomicrobium hirschii]KPL52019.1 enoyl-CoA hydratase [Prosthecomicrobium hirschii]